MSPEPIDQPIRALLDALDPGAPFELVGADHHPIIRPIDAVQINAMREGLNRWLTDLFDGARSANSVKALVYDLRYWIGWCEKAKAAALPASQETLDRFFREHRDQRKHSTLRRYSASIGQMHEAAALQNPCRTKRIKDTLDLVQRQQQNQDLERVQKNKEQQYAVRQATGFREKDLAAMDQAIVDRFGDDLSLLTLRELRDVALMWVAHDTLLRASELSRIQIEHLDSQEDGSYALAVYFTKTTKDGRARHRYISPHARRYLDEWLRAAETRGGADFKTNGSVFRTVIGKHRVEESALSRQAMWRMVKRTAANLGLEGSFSAHSTRVGTAQDMTAQGLSMAQIMQSGGWKTEVMPQQYGDSIRAKESGAAELARQSGRAPSRDEQ